MKKGRTKMSRQERIGLNVLRYLHSLGAREGGAIDEDSMEKSAAALEADLKYDGISAMVSRDGFVDFGRLETPVVELDGPVAEPAPAV